MKTPLTNISVTRRPAPTKGALDDEPEEATVESNGNDQPVTTTSVSGQPMITASIESEFLRKLRAKLIGNVPSVQAWPLAEIMDMESEVSDEFTDAFQALFLALEGAMPPFDGRAGSAKKLIMELIEETEWPAFNDKVPVPAPWNVAMKQDAFRRYEVSAAMDVMMRLYHAKGAGAPDSPKLPPDG